MFRRWAAAEIGQLFERFGRIFVNGGIHEFLGLLLADGAQEMAQRRGLLLQFEGKLLVRLQRRRQPRVLQRGSGKGSMVVLMGPPARESKTTPQPKGD